MQLMDAPKVIMNRKKKAMEAEAVSLWMMVPDENELWISPNPLPLSYKGWICTEDWNPGHTFEGKKNGDHHHAEEKAEGSPEHGLPTTKSIDEEGWVE